MILDKDVVIVGGGIIGFSLALSLHKNNLQVAIIEADQINYKPLNTDKVEARVSAINHTSKNLLQHLEVWDDIKNKRISPYYQMNVWDDQPNQNISIIAEEINQHNLGYIIENDLITRTLLAKIVTTSIEIFDNCSIKEIQNSVNGKKIILNDKTINTSLIVGADGAHSFIRNYFNFQIKSASYRHTAIVTTVRLKKEHKQTAYQRFYTKGVLAFLPLEDSTKASIVWSVKTSYADFLMSIDEQKFATELTNAINNILGDLKLLSKRFSFKLTQRHAKSYIQDNVVLIGDAAHTIHPLAGQGVNLGFKDVVSLARVLSEAFVKGRIIGNLSTLDKYQRDRKLDNTKMIILMKAFKEVFASDNYYLKKARRLGLEFVNNNNIAKRLIVKQAL